MVNILSVSIKYASGEALLQEVVLQPWAVLGSSGQHREQCHQGGGHQGDDGGGEREGGGHQAQHLPVTREK